MTNIVWHTEKKKVSELKLLENNPRTISKEGFEKLQKDIESVGDFKPLICDSDLTVLGGNQRKRIHDLKGDVEVEVSMPSRKLTESERKKVIVLDNEHRGEFDLDMLANEFEETLKELGFDEYVADFEPVSKEQQGDIDKLAMIKCPKCGHEFTKDET